MRRVKEQFTFVYFIPSIQQYEIDSYAVYLLYWVLCL